jgi:hypothetical protein
MAVRRANSADGVAVIEALLKAKPKAFRTEAEVQLNASHAVGHHA